MYTPTNWQTGDVITADKLNHMEEGISGSGYDLILGWDDEENTYTGIGKSFDELFSKISSGMPLNAWFFDGSYYPMICACNEEDNYILFRYLILMNDELQLDATRIKLSSDGMAVGSDINPEAYAYTYSNGKYTFTYFDPSNQDGQ